MRDSIGKEGGKGGGRDVPASLVPVQELIFRELEEGFSHEGASAVQDGSGDFGLGPVRAESLDFVKGCFDARFVGDVGRDAQCLAAGFLDLGGDAFVICGRSGEEDYGVSSWACQ